MVIFINVWFCVDVVFNLDLYEGKRMVEKRFTHKDKSLYIDDGYFCELEDGDEITELLNRQQHTVETVWKENEQLKQRINSRLHFYRELYDSTEDIIAKRVVEDLEDILFR